MPENPSLATGNPPSHDPASLDASTPAVVGGPPMRPVPQFRRPPPRHVVVPVHRGIVPAIAVAGLAAAVLIPLDRPGIGWLLTGLVFVAVVWAADRAARRAFVAGRKAELVVDAEPGEAEGVEEESELVGPGAGSEPGNERRSGTAESMDCDEDEWPEERPARRWGRWWWSVLALGLLGIGTLRAAPWLFVLCVLAAMVAGSMAVVGRRSVYGVLADAVAVTCAAVVSVPWVYRAAVQVRGRRAVIAQRVWMSVLVTAGLLLVFVPLLAGADPVFEHLVAGILPRVDVASLARWGMVFGLGALGTAGALYLLAGPLPAAADFAQGTDAGDMNAVAWLGRRRLSRIEWGIPVVALTVVFAVFVATQLAVLFGGDGYVQRTAELTYAEYARSGFWQLSVVSMLALVVISVVQRVAAQQSPSERAWLRAGLAAVSVLTLVIVASALHRMWTYQQAYGFTVMRLLVEVFELWIGLVYLLVLASLVTLPREWVPRAAVGLAAATLLVLALMNPEGLVADRNVTRWQDGKNFDSDYLSGLSPDILPALDRLPPAQRDPIEQSIRAHAADDSWQGWNLARERARR
ncbi:DUF4153 domain-containing protein [Nocardia sp. NPDC088792]|uniref:DUF4153 domain-containing protein n=1 Tax=Nocardia sp. NPDC088792 TaxID=3364332 RepID=UPI00382E505D